MLVLFLLVLVWSPTGAAPIAEKTPIAYLAVGSQGYWQVWLTDVEGQHRYQASDSAWDKTSLSWHPDGNRLLINGNQGELAWLVLDKKRDTTKKSTEQTIALPVSGMTDARLSPDGKKIVFSLNASPGISDDSNIWLVNSDGQQLKKLTNLSGLQHVPRWHPDGERIYFLSKQGQQAQDIWQLTLASMQLVQLTANALYNLDVAVSNDHRMAYSSNRHGAYQLYVQALDQPAGTATALTSGQALDANPCWSPDGQWLVFDSSRSGRPNLWLLKLKNRAIRQISFHKKGARLPVWYDAGAAK